MQELFISLSERENLNRFPSDIPEDDLIAFFTLSTIDKGLLLDRRGDHNRLGFALQLCTVRYLGVLSRRPCPHPADRHQLSGKATGHNISRCLDTSIWATGAYPDRSSPRYS